MIPSNWKIFVLGNEKIPLPNCPSCREAGPHHDRESCTCLTCHGIYAATNDTDRIAEMIRRHPDNPWAVRTGQVNNIVVLDAEGTGSPTGVEVLDNLEMWTGFDLPPTRLRAATPSGGVHVYYRYASGVRSRNRVLPQVDVKSDGGYVVIPSTPGGRRRWIEYGDPWQMPDPLVDWLRGPRGRSGPGGVRASQPAGYDFDRFVREGCPGGMRDEFFNDAIFRLRKRGVGRQATTIRLRELWHACRQPPDADWYMPWWHVEYKIERVWRTVEPDPEPTEAQREWALNTGGKVGRVTLAPRRTA